MALLSVGTASSPNISGTRTATSPNINYTGLGTSPNVSPVRSGSQVSSPNISGVYSSPQGGTMYDPSQSGYYNGGYAQQVEGMSTVAQQPERFYLPNGQLASSAAEAQAARDNQAYYNDIASQLQGQIGQLDNQQNIGLGNINNSYNISSNRLDQQHAIAKRDYDTGVQNNSQQYLNTRNGVMQNSRATTNALQRLLGINGAGNSSAAFEQAPYAVGLQASQNLTGAQQTFAQNGRSLDTGWQDTQRSYNNGKDDLNNQKYQQENGLKGSIAQTRASLLDKIANARVQAQVAGGSSYAQAAAARTPFQSQINDLLSQITNYGNQYANPVVRTADIAYKAPDLGQYQLGQFGIGNGQTQAGAQSDMNPTFLNLLTGKKDEQQGGLF